MNVEQIIAGILAREGGFRHHADDAGGPTNWGITKETARLFGYTGRMEDLPRELAERIYLERYYRAPGFEFLARRIGKFALGDKLIEELVDTGVNMNPKVSIVFLQRVLNALNLKSELYPDVPVDGSLGERTASALCSFCIKRGAEGQTVLLKALNCLQGARYIELAEKRERNEAFIFGWLRARIGV